MSILVTGGAGYIGSHAVYDLLESYENIVVIDNLSTGHREAVHPNAVFFKGDLRDRAFLDSVFDHEPIDAVIHFAADSLVGESMSMPLKYYDNNVCGAKTLLESMVSHDIKNIVFSSTAAVYGEPAQVPITEDSKTNPESTYGETKLAIERMMHWVSLALGIKYVSLRYFNACGAHPSGKIGEAHNPETHLIPNLLKVPGGQRDSITINGTDYPTRDGTCIRDYVHVTDLVRAHILAADYLLNNPGSKSEIINLGSGIGYSNFEIADAARKATGYDIPIVTGPRRAGDPAALIASIKKAKEILGWSPEITNPVDMISSAWNWHKNR